jgi:KUP system potassium uptake protein
VIVRHGYNERIVSKDLANLIYDQLRHFITSGTSESVTFYPPGNGANGNIDPSREIEVLERAFGTQVLYAVGKEQLKIILPKGLSIKGFLRSVFLNAFIWMRDMTRSKIQEMDLPYDRLIEVAFVKEM